MTHAAFFPLVVACSLAASGASRAQPADVAALALYEGADREQRLVKGARTEREINLYSSLVLEDLNALAAAFDKKYGVKLKFWRAGSEKVVQRTVTEARAGRFDFDVVETNGPELESLHREKLLQKAGSPHFPDLLPEAVRPHREWIGTRLNLFVHAYNTNLVKKEELPRSWDDLLQPRWKGRLGIEAEDADWLAVGTAIARPNGVAIARRAPNPHAALLFYDFEISEEGQKVLLARDFVPTNKKVDTPLGRLPLKFVDARVMLDEYDKWVKLYEEIFGKGR